MTIRLSLVWSLSQQVGLYVLQFVNMVVIARLLTPEEVGVFVLAVSISVVLLVIREFGLTNYLITVKDLSRENLRTTLGLSVIMATIMGVSVLVFRHPIETFLNAPGSANVLICVAGMIFLSPLELPAQAILRREMKFDVLHHAALVSKFIGVAVSIGLAWAGYSYMALAWALVLEAAIRSCWVALAEPRALKSGIAFSKFREVLSFSIWSTGVSLTMSITQMVEKLLVGRVLGVAAAGIYDRALQIPLMLRLGMILVTGRVFVSAFATDVREGRALGQKVQRLVGMTTVLLWPVYAILTLISEELVSILFGPGWEQVAVIMPWVFAAQGLQAALIPPEHVLFPNGRAFRAFCNRAMQLVLYATVVGYGLSQGLEVFLPALVVASGLVIVLNWIALRPFVDVTAWDMSMECLRSLVITACSAAPVIIVLLTVPSASGIWILAALAITPFAWLAACYATGHEIFPELARIVRLVSRRESPNQP